MLSSHQTLLLRADASPATGLNRLNRCVQLAQAWQSLGGRAVVACGDLPRRLTVQLTEQGIRLHRLAQPAGSRADADELSQFAERIQPTWLMLDGTCFGSEYRRCLSVSEICQLAAFEANAWGNASTGADEALVKEPLSTPRMLTLPIYPPGGGGLVGDRTGDQNQDTSAPSSGTSRIPSVAKRLLVWLNPAVEPETVREVVAQLMSVCAPRSSIEVVVSPGHRDAAPVLTMKRMQGNSTVRIIHSAQRRLASTVPVHLAVTDDELITDSLIGRRIPAITIASATEVSVDQPKGFRRRLSQLIRDAGRRQVLLQAQTVGSDQDAARRLARRLASHEIRLLAAESADWSAVWQWTRHSESKAVSLSIVGNESTGVSNAAQAHDAYLDALENSTLPRWIARRPDGQAIAFLALNGCSVEGSANVQIIVDPSFRNQGVGTALLERVVERVLLESTMHRTTAPLPDTLILQASLRNYAAHRMALNAGFAQAAPAIVCGAVVHQFLISRRSMTGQPVFTPKVQRRSA